MKEFDLKKAIAGAKVITRDGRDVPSVRYYPNNGTSRVVLADVTLFGKNDVAPHSFYEERLTAMETIDNLKLRDI